MCCQLKLQHPTPHCKLLLSHRLRQLPQLRQLLHSTLYCKCKSTASIQTDIKSLMLEIVDGGMWRPSGQLKFRDCGPQWRRAVLLRLWATLSSTTFGKPGGGLLHRVTRQKEFVWCWTGGATLAMVELK